MGLRYADPIQVQKEGTRSEIIADEDFNPSIIRESF